MIPISPYQLLMPPTTNNDHSNMPTENSFKQQAELACTMLRNFNMVKSFESPVLTKTALNELLNATVGFISFSH